MDGRQSEYPQSDQASAAQYHPGQDVRSSNFSSSATPTSEYGLPPSSARSGSFPEYLQQHQRYHPSSGQSGNAGGMAQTTSPSMPLTDGQSHNHQNGGRNNNSDSDVPIDPSIAASSPSYPPHGQYSPYPPQQHDMAHYAGQPGTPQMYGRPEWGGHYPPGPPHMPQYGHPPSSSAGAPPMAAQVPRPPAGGHPLSTVYSFVPIPGAQQHKRPRRRYEEIERMYKCGWNGCEKAYGTLNHLNAHVTMQSHGTKRTPEEFKEIRKEWKQKKKDEENARKAEEDRQRQTEGRTGAENGAQPGGAPYGEIRSHMLPPSMNGNQLPPIGYAPAGGQVPAQYGAPNVEGNPQYANSQLYNNSYPQSPYGPNNPMYQQRYLPSHNQHDGEADVKADPDAGANNTFPQ
ncbi:hypothetical protein B0A49_02881 [Cryomyces minteri]|uniref:C2H2-type domain-containing protein n=1 Tax=Cryomyces minteri TaxID=331657 RepID=A0A4U0X787_9PEZI|nr:hypothetical protein B0A49_02881 [Cryomyces minteri]